MKRLLFVLLICAIGAMDARAQKVKIDSAVAETKDSLPYLKYPTLPAFNIMLTDSSTIYNTFNIPRGNTIALMMFDPECKHCRDLMRRMIKGMDSLKGIDFYLLTAAHSMTAIRKFYDDFNLSAYKNIKIIGRDYEFFFHEYYGVKFVPDIALYDKNKNLIKLFEGDKLTIEELYNYSR